MVLRLQRGGRLSSRNSSNTNGNRCFECAATGSGGHWRPWPSRGVTTPTTSRPACLALAWSRAVY